MEATVTTAGKPEDEFDFKEEGRWYDLPLAAVLAGGRNGMAFAIWAAGVVATFSLVHWILGAVLVVLTILVCLIIMLSEIDDCLKQESETEHFCLLWKETGVIHKSGLASVHTRPRRFSQYSILGYSPVFEDSLQVNAGPEKTVRAAVHLKIALPLGDSERLSAFIRYPKKERGGLIRSTFVRAVADFGAIGTSKESEQSLQEAVQREMHAFLPSDTIVHVSLGYYQ